MKRKLLSLTLVLALVLSLVPMGAFAAAIDTLAVTPGSLETNALTTYTVDFDNTGGTVVPIDGFVKVTFPAGYDLSKVDATDVAFTTANGMTKSAVTVDNTLRTVLVKTSTVQTGAGQFVFTIADVRNPSTIGAKTIQIDTLNAASAALDTDTAATSALVTTANQFTSIVSTDKTSASADGSSGIKFTAYIYNANNVAVEDNTKVYVDSSRGTTENFQAGVYGYTPAAGDVPQYYTTTGGKVEFKVYSNAVGTAKIGLTLAEIGGGVSSEIQKYLTGTSDSTINSSSLKFIGSKDITFTATSTTGVSFVSKQGYDVNDNTKTTPVANNLEYYTIKWKVVAGTAPVAGQTVDFTVSDSAAVLSKTTATTDAAGMVSLNVYATKSGSYTVKASAAGFSDEQTAAFDAAGVNKVVLDSTDNQLIAKDSTASFSFRLYDALNNQIKVTSSNLAAMQTATDVTVVTEPDGSSITPNSTEAASDEMFKITTSNLSKEGDYKLRVSLSNGAKAEVSFKVKTQGTITDISFVYDETALSIGSTSGTPTVKLLDAAGVKKTAPVANLVYSVSDASLATVDNNSGNATFGAVTIPGTTDKEDIGKTVTITVTDKTNNLSKSFAIKINGKIATIAAKVAGTAKVGTQVPVEVTVLDTKGNVTSGMDNSPTIATKIVTLTKPADAIVGSDTSATFAGDLAAYGKGTIYVTSNKAGKAMINIQVTDGQGTPVTYQANVEVDFGAADMVASKTVVLTIGSKTGFNNNAPVTSDLAPFIQDGRTFVPVSFIAAQLGGSAEFTKNAAGLVDTVTVKVGTTTVTMTIGSTTIKVVKDGKESTVTTDVAPFIKSGRTVLPFRAVAEAFGAKVTFGPETGSVEWVKFEM